MAGQEQPSALVQALGQMLQEAQQREAGHLVRAVLAERRADEAEQALAAAAARPVRRKP